MRTILVVDDMAIFREPIATALAHRGYRALTAADGREALKIVETQRPDLILLDIVMPGMDGLTFLKLLRDLPTGADLPVILLTSMTDKSQILRSRQLGVQGYLLKSQFSLEDVESRIRRLLGEEPVTTVVESAARAVPEISTVTLQAPKTRHRGSWLGRSRDAASASPAEIPRLLSREETFERLQHVTGLKTLAGVVAEVVKIAGSARGDLSDLSVALRRDPILSSRVLHAANSAAYATGRPLITTIEEAVRNIGFGAVRNLAVSVGIFETLPPSAKDGFNSIRCWQHGLAVAAILERLVPPDRAGAPVPSGLAHVIGLCHDLAETILHDVFADEYAQLADAAADARRGGASWSDVHRIAFGVSHDTLVGNVLALIGLPPEVVQPIKEFFQSALLKPSKSVSVMARLLGIANQLAHGLLLAPSTHSALVGPVTQNECQSILNGAELPLIDADTLHSDVFVMTHHLAQLPPKESQILAQPLFPRRDVTVIYVRHSTFSNLDPLALALQNLAETVVHDELPEDVELWSKAAGLVVAAPKYETENLSIAAVDAARKAADRVDLPVLFIAGRGDPIPAAPPLFEQTHYPISLDELHSFIQAI